MASNTDHGTSLSQDISGDVSNASLESGADNLSPIEMSVNDLAARMAALEEQLASGECNVSDVEYQLGNLQAELTQKLNGIEPSVAQEADALATAGADDMADQALALANLEPAAGDALSLEDEAFDGDAAPKEGDICEADASSMLAAGDGTLVGGIVEDVLQDSAEAEIIEDGDGESGDAVAQNAAQNLANIEPAAGDAGGAGASSNGFGFQSTFAAGPIDSLEDVGPIDPTQLEYGIEFQNEEVRPEEEDPIREDDEPLILKPAAVDLDESNLDLNQTGSLEVDFGNDGAGVITSNGVYNVLGSYDGIQLQSDGVDVIIEPTNDGYVGTANGQTVFTLTINPENGDYEYNQVLAFDHADSNDPNDVITLEFGVQATDGNGSIASETLTINVADDAPAIAKPDVVDLDESNLSLNQSGSMEIDFGNDGVGSVASNGDINVSGSVNGPQLQSNGVDVLIAATVEGYVGTANGQTVFTLTIDPSNGNYTYNQIQPFDHADSNDPNDVITLEFGVQVRDGDGDSAVETLTINVADDAPIANDDLNRFDSLDDVATGNVITGENGGPNAADDLSVDRSNTVSSVSFEGNSVDVPETGTVSLDGEFGTLEIAADGSYTYDLFDGAGSGQTIYSFNKDNPPGSDKAGDIQNVNTTYNSDNHEFSFSMTVEDSAQGFTVALNNGPNPKGHGGEMALFYFDASGAEPVVSVYAYNGLNTQTSWLDGGQDAGNQPSDKIATSLGADSPFTSITVTTDANGNKVMSFTMDGTDVISHNPAYGPDGDWSGFAFDSSVGIWLHPSSGLQTEYGDDGYLTKWDTDAQSYYDTSNQPAEVKHIGGSEICDEFEYTLVDGDGDTSTAILKLEGLEPTLIVGKNVDDQDGSNTPHFIGGDEAAIIGGAGSDVLVGDIGGSSMEQQTQDYNVLFVIDVSGSMGDNDGSGKKIDLLQDAIDSLIRDFGDYQGGDVQVHFAPFNKTAGAGASFNVSDAQGLNDAVSYLNALQTGGWTNYEAGLQSGIALLQGDDALSNAETITYFISDGEPNHFVNNSGGATKASADTVIGEITGSDGTDEVAILQQLSSEVIGVGIDIGNNITRIDVIDSDGNSINVDDPSDLKSALAETNPLLKLASVGDDFIEGGDGDDVIFGDSVNTDALADAHGITSDDGSGWSVFEQLENGESTLQGAWDRADTVDYIRANSDSLAEESVNLQGLTREGGDDELHGGDGDDVIYGQEGDDVLYGGAGNDTLVGGSGADTFMMEAVNQGIDVIRDFGADEGDVLDFSTMIQNYDPSQQAIDNFVFAREVDGGTILSIDVSGNGDAGNAIDLVALEGLQGLDLQALVESGNINVM